MINTEIVTPQHRHALPLLFLPHSAVWVFEAQLVEIILSCSDPHELSETCCDGSDCSQVFVSSWFKEHRSWFKDRRASALRFFLTCFHTALRCSLEHVPALFILCGAPLFIGSSFFTSACFHIDNILVLTYAFTHFLFFFQANNFQSIEASTFKYFLGFPL